MDQVEPDIRRAWTPPSRIYSDPGTYSLLRERAFARSWQFVGDTDLAKVPGQVHPFTLLEGCLDEPVVLARDADDRLRALSNVCTHRGMVVCEGAGNERFLRCRYHGRRFGLDGRFQSMPEFEGVEGFPSEADDLRQIALESWSTLLFLSLEPEAPFARVMAPIFERVGWLPLHEFSFAPERARDYLVQANWALYVDNYLEGFHIPFIHAELNEAIDYGTYTDEPFEFGTLQLAFSKGGDAVFDLPTTSPDHGKAISAYYYWLFPNTMLNFYPWGLSVNVVRPLGPERTKVSFLPYVWKPELVGVGAGAALDRVEREDEAVVELVQRGIKSRFYDRGRYSPAREKGTHHFHQMLMARLGSNEHEGDVS